jgi:chromosome segregation and condensation protein ScpB
VHSVSHWNASAPFQDPWHFRSSKEDVGKMSARLYDQLSSAALEVLAPISIRQPITAVHAKYVKHKAAHLCLLTGYSPVRSDRCSTRFGSSAIASLLKRAEK